MRAFGEQDLMSVEGKPEVGVLDATALTIPRSMIVDHLDLEFAAPHFALHRLCRQRP